MLSVLQQSQADSTVHGHSASSDLHVCASTRIAHPVTESADAGKHLVASTSAVAYQSEAPLGGKRRPDPKTFLEAKLRETTSELSPDDIAVVHAALHGPGKVGEEACKFTLPQGALRSIFSALDKWDSAFSITFPDGVVSFARSESSPKNIRVNVQGQQAKSLIRFTGVLRTFINNKRTEEEHVVVILNGQGALNTDVTDLVLKGIGLGKLHVTATPQQQSRMISLVLPKPFMFDLLTLERHLIAHSAALGLSGDGVAFKGNNVCLRIRSEHGTLLLRSSSVQLTGLRSKEQETKLHRFLLNVLADVNSVRKTFPTGSKDLSQPGTPENMPQRNPSPPQDSAHNHLVTLEDPSAPASSEPIITAAAPGTFEPVASKSRDRLMRKRGAIDSARGGKRQLVAPTPVLVSNATGLDLLLKASTGQGVYQPLSQMSFAPFMQTIRATPVAK